MPLTDRRLLTAFSPPSRLLAAFCPPRRLLAAASPSRLLLTCCFSPPSHRRLPPRRLAASLQPFADSLPLPPCRLAASEPPCCPVAASPPLRRLCSALESPIPPPHTTTPPPPRLKRCFAASPLRLAAPPCLLTAVFRHRCLRENPPCLWATSHFHTEHRHRLNGYISMPHTGHALDVCVQAQAQAQAQVQVQ